jgi:Domain of unknown function (DUF4279)
MEEERKHELRLYIILLSQEIEPSNISKMLSLEPDRTAEKGLPVRERAAPPAAPQHNLWQLHSKADPINSRIEDQFQGLKDAIGDSYGKVATLPAEIKCICKCVVYSDKPLPDLSFSPEHLAFMSNMNATLEIAVFSLNNEE